VLASAEGQHTPTIARTLRCHDQTVRNAIHAFNQRGLRARQPQSSSPHRTQAVFDTRRRERLRALLHQSPRLFGRSTSVWTLALVAEVSYAQGLTPRQVSGEAIRLALQQLGVRWKRAKQWITSPDPAYLRKKTTVVKLTHEAPKAVPMQKDMPLSHDAFASTYSAYPFAAGD
jgi:transposase